MALAFNLRILLLKVFVITVIRMDYLFRSSRLGFRQWQSSDIKPFSEMCRDEVVMEFFPKLLTEEETMASVLRFSKSIEELGHGFFAVDLLSTNTFIGFIGYIYQTMNVSFAPCFEIGWRLDRKVWNHGLATEGAKASLEHAFTYTKCKEMYSITPVQNVKSERIMQKLGMHHIGYFEHPLLDPSSDLRKHTIYKVTNPIGSDTVKNI